MYSEESPQAAITSSACVYLAENPSLSEFTSASGSTHPRHHSAWAQSSRVLSPFNSSWSWSVLWCSAPCRDEAIARGGCSSGLGSQIPVSVAGQGEGMKHRN